jgi:hypothetical protein
MPSALLSLELPTSGINGIIRTDQGGKKGEPYCPEMPV